MRLSIMQPYFFPYIGYFQLIAASDVFVIYDNIKYTKKGWINRNRILVDGTDAMLSLPLQKASDTLDVRDRCLAMDYNPEKLLSQIKGAYFRAPFFSLVFPLLERVFRTDERNLFGYVHASVLGVCQYLGIMTEIRISSNVAVDHTLRGESKVLAICNALGADAYLNTVGGVDLYSNEHFSERGVNLQFIKSTPFEYTQFGAPFVPWLSIIDVLMFNSPEIVREYILTNYELI